MAASADVTEISASVLPRRLVKADAFWQNARAVQDFNLTPKCATLRGLLRQQTAKFAALSNDPTRSPIIDIAWVQACNGTATVDTDVWIHGIPCDFSGWLVGTAKQTYTLKQRVKTAFNIPVEIYDNLHTREELLEKGLAKAQKVLAEKLDDIAIAKLVLYAGLNKYQDADDLGAAAGTVGNEWKRTKLPWKNLYRESLAQYLQKVIDENDFSSAKLYTGGILSLSEFVNNDNKDEFNFADLPVIQDRRGFNAQNLKNDMFLVATGAMALITSNNNPSTASEFQNITRLARPLLDLRDGNGRPVYYDMYVKRVQRNVNQDDHPDFDTTGRCEYMDNFYMEIHYDWLLNPTACGDATTGVVRFTADRTMEYVESPGPVVRTMEYV